MTDVQLKGEEALRKLEEDLKKGKAGGEEEEVVAEEATTAPEVVEEGPPVEESASGVKPTKPEPVEEEEDPDPEPEPTPEEAAAIRESRKALLANVLSKGILNDKLSSLIEQAVPRGRKGKFVRDADGDIVRYKGLGYTFAYAKDTPASIIDSMGRVRVGDLILMTVSDEDRTLLKEVRRDRVKKNLTQGRKQFMEDQRKAHEEKGAPIPFDDSQTISMGRGG